MRAPPAVRLLFFALSCAAPAAAQACAVIIVDPPSYREQMRRARATLREATAVIDGEVVRPMAGGQPALVRAARVLKGPVQHLYAVGERDSCDHGLRRAGERLRMILVGGPDLYYLPIDTSNQRFEDGLLRSDRRKVWPYREGEPGTP